LARPKKKSNPVGKPPKILSQEQIIELSKLAGYGLTQEQIADYFEIGSRTLRTKIAEDEEISAAYKKGRMEAISQVVGKLRDKINHGNVLAMIFYLKTQAGWHETVKSEISGPGGQPIQMMNLQVVTDEKLDEIIAEARRCAAAKPS
jgi:hypothetical protein